MKGTDRRRRPGAVIALLAAALAAAAVGSLALGRYPIDIRIIGGILLSRVAAVEPFWEPVQEWVRV